MWLRLFTPPWEGVEWQACPLVMLSQAGFLEKEDSQAGMDMRHFLITPLFLGKNDQTTYKENEGEADM